MSLAERLSGLSELLIALAASPIPTHLFQALADQAAGAVPCDYLGLCLKDADESGYLVHSLIGARRTADSQERNALSSAADRPRRSIRSAAST